MIKILIDFLRLKLGRYICTYIYTKLQFFVTNSFEADQTDLTKQRENLQDYETLKNKISSMTKYISSTLVLLFFILSCSCMYIFEIKTERLLSTPYARGVIILDGVLDKTAGVIFNFQYFKYLPATQNKRKQTTVIRQIVMELYITTVQHNTKIIQHYVPTLIYTINVYKSFGRYLRKAPNCFNHYTQ